MLEADSKSSSRDRVGTYNASKITSLLWQGDAWLADDEAALDFLGIGAILNVTYRDEASERLEKKTVRLAANGQKVRKFLYKHIEVRDTDDFDLATVLPEAYRFINKCRNKRGRTVLVHCAMGISRSSAIIIGYLMRAWRWRFAETFTYLCERHPIARPNLGFRQQLAAWDSGTLAELPLGGNPGLVKLLVGEEVAAQKKASAYVSDDEDERYESGGN